MSSAPYYPDAVRSSVFREGVEFQDFVCLQLAARGLVLQNFASKKYQIEHGENVQGAEIKLDTRCTETGRLSIEVAEKTQAANTDWVPSGILRGDNSWLYIQGNRDVLFVFARNWLQRYYRERNPRVHESHGTVRKFYLSLEDAKKYAARWFDLRGGP